MLERWGRLLHRRRRPALVLSVIALVIAAVWGTGVFGALSSAGGFTTPGSESAAAVDAAERALGRDATDVVVLYRAPRGRTIDDPSVRAAIDRQLGALPKDRVASAGTYWSTRSPALVSHDRTATYAALRLAGATDQARSDAYEAVKPRLERADGLTVRLGGPVATETAVNDRVSADIGRAEGLSLPILLILLVVIFGGLVAASLPLVIGGVAILGSFTALHVLTAVTDVSIFAVNITTFLGLGLAIDYGLFIVSRFREELDGPDGVEGALGRTMATAGRTVLVSGVTVAVSLAGLTLFPQMFLRSMGFGGVATVLVCAAAALTVLPVLLALLGRRVDALSFRRRRTERKPEDQGRWYRLGRGVMRRPVLALAGIVVVLLALGSPLLRISWGGNDARVLPAGAETRVAAEALDRDFPGGATTPIRVIVTGMQRPGDATGFAATLARIPGVAGAAVARARGGAAEIDVRYPGDPDSGTARRIVADVRAAAPPPGARVLVGGETAELVDSLHALGSRLPWLALTVGLATFVLLFLAFGSVVLPLKAILMTALSLSATFGIVVQIFQEGTLSDVLGFTATGMLNPAMPILMVAMLFGLTMDYEVFLLSRVRERYDATGDVAASVASGLQRTGQIITGAAALFIVVMGAFSTSGVSFIKMTGVGMVVAVALDATLVRMLLVPAAMRLLGRVNWWSPGPLARLYRRYGIREEAAPPVLEPAGT
ncbi:Membrane protein YdfJ [Actinomadura rubteroloni]|uniref:Membrane protein YdfJ n=1 Tax=Actinomadura rubteroloni TaxID=1926885 RepID=A0A2P4UII7_9ACTN|nr:MMPL family transporter [Actinomadura rubteroloni]POM24846.1 Membrane protein YdfJ [Actinomadura rubteroloni]